MLVLKSNNMNNQDIYVEKDVNVIKKKIQVNYLSVSKKRVPVSGNPFNMYLI